MRAAAGALIGLFALVFIALLTVVGWQAGWWLQKANADKGYQVTTHTQGYQAGLISAERDRVAAWTVATDPDQRTLISHQFCAVFGDLTTVPSDLASASATIGCA